MTAPPIDFERAYGVNAGYVEALFGRWLRREDVGESWERVFERLAPEQAAERAAQALAAASPTTGTTGAPEAKTSGAPAEELPADDADASYEALRGISARIVENMSASLALPTATSVRTLPVKILDENRRVLNDHMRVRALGKASFTHCIAFALVRALNELPSVQSSYLERGGKGFRRLPRHVNLGIAIDLATDRGRMLVVPNIKAAEQHDFRAFRMAYEDVVARARDGKLTADDYRGTTCTLTNPGGFGTSLSVPRLMEGQGLIVGLGSIGVPPEARDMAKGARAELALGPVMTVTSTYDHRVIQGAESGLLLRRLEALLSGEDGFWDEVFASMRVPWAPVEPAPDRGASFSEETSGEVHARLWAMINAYRVRGCRLADLDPLEYRPDRLESLDPAFYGFTVWDLDREFRVDGMVGRDSMTLREILDVLRQSYCRRWTVEYMHISDRTRKHWMRDRIEPSRNDEVFDEAARRTILTRLSKAENFERFLHTRYVGNKRFSLEGADTLIPALAELIDHAAEGGVEKVVIGMAHRGRLNVLANILNKSYEQIFREFEGALLPLSTEGASDVKYHLGQRGTYTTPEGREVEVVLSANPSHLEAVDPVVCGMTRAYQDELADDERKKVLAVLIHGDAAFSGQGVVAETFNMSALRATTNGGTIHLVVNNQIGFTASPRDLRSTYYCTDVAKSVQAPILHANGDNPEAVLKAVRVAVDYQRNFGSDAVVDMVCYRRRGHNEGDEPAFTQPVLYAKIANHPTVLERYCELVVRRGQLTQEDADAIAADFESELRSALEAQRAESHPELTPDEVLDRTDHDPADWCDEPSPETGVAAERLIEIIDVTNRVPDGHVTHPNLLRQLRRREGMVRGDAALDWGCAEACAFGSILVDGTPIRLAGQDSGRGTFSHRHAVIRDQATEREHVPLSELAPAGVGFEAWDSLLSEEAALAYEYGYACARPRALVIWEAQFGDFVNGAQIAIDQFLTSGETKWRQTSGVVLLLPHGYDGQGPEHSSARPERFLQLCSAGNVTVVNCTSAAQYFHLLRRHVASEPRRPLIVFTPKSLLRDKRAASPIEELAEGSFREVIATGAARDARRVLLSFGKVHYDLAGHLEQSGRDDVALVRVEQLYPFPRRALEEALASHPGAELVWVQEEPRNMGAWTFVQDCMQRLERPIAYAGRATSASPATGSYARHQAEQSYLVRRAFGELAGEPATEALSTDRR